jgi:hypothetical protein
LLLLLRLELYRLLYPAYFIIIYIAATTTISTSSALDRECDLSSVSLISYLIQFLITAAEKKQKKEKEMERKKSEEGTLEAGDRSPA